MQIDLRPHQKEWLEKAIELAFATGITIYDSSYIGLANVLNAPVITADERLIKKVKQPYLVHISEVGRAGGVSTSDPKRSKQH